jgi:hypothetical protein
MARQKKVNTMQSDGAQLVLQNLVIRQARIESADIDAWKTAVNSAKKGIRTKLYDLYENLLADPVLSDAVDKRVNAITNAELAFLRNGENVEEIDDLIDTPEFEELIREIILHKAWGKSVIEVKFTPQFDIFSFPRKHIKIANLDKKLAERKRYIIAKEGDLTGYEYSEDEQIIECGKDDDLGFLFKAAPYVIYKRGGFGDWAEFAEVFGMPFLVGKYPGYDPKTKDLLFQALSDIGSRPRAAIPKETELQVYENKSSGSNNLYQSFRLACNEEILISVLGNTMTTLSGSSRSQAEVHKDTQEGISAADRRYVQRILNRRLLPLLLKRGYDVAGGFFTFPDKGESLSTMDRIDIALKIKNDAKVPVSDDYFYEISGIPKAEAGEPGPKEPDPTDPEPEPEPPQKPKKKGLKSFFASAPAVKSGANQPGFITRLIWSITGKVKFDDKYSINVSKLVDEALREIYGSDYQQLVNARLWDISNNVLQHALTVEFDKEGADWGETNKDFINEIRTNTAVFAAFKNHQQTSDIVGLLIDEKGELRSFSKFRKLALQISEKYNVNWLQTEYNTAVRIARAAINYRKYLANEKLYPNLEYIESIATEKRSDHLEYVGTILPIRHPWWKIHLPPSEWNCQCSVKPTNKEVTDVPDEGEPVNPVFANNPGETGKLINTEETQYYKNTPEELRDQLTEFAKRAEKIRQRIEELKLKMKAYKNGGYLNIPAKRNDKTARNQDVYARLAEKEGEKYTLMPGDKDPDAVNLKTYEYSRAYVAGESTVKNAIQNGIKAASLKKTGEAVIFFDRKISAGEIKAGLKAALQKGRAKVVKQIIVIDTERTRRYNADELRKVFK